MAQTPFKARLGLETSFGQDINSGGDIKINGVSINTGGTLDNVFYLDTQDMDDVADGATYVKTENNLTDTMKTNYDSAYTHSTTITGNPHAVTKTDVGLSDVVNADTTNADNISDGTTNAIITLTQETNFETAYSKSHDQNTDTGTSSDDFSIGDGTDTDKTISIDNGDANSPQLKYTASTNKWQYSNDGVTFSDIGSGGSGSAEVVYLEVNQVGHGFDNDFVYNNGTTWVKAQANSDTTTATHFAVRVDDDNFQATIIGEVDVTGMTDDNSQALTTNTYYFLSQTVAGKLATTEPVTGIKQVVMKTNTTNNATISIEIPFDLAKPSNLAYMTQTNRFIEPQVIDTTSIDALKLERVDAGGGTSLLFENGDDEQARVWLDGSQNLRFEVGGTISTDTKMLINSSGNVGIGTDSPSEKLDVNGNINFSTNGDDTLISNYKGANSDGKNIFIGGGGQSSIGEVGATYKGAYNTALGYNSLYSNTTGSSNTSLGHSSLYSNTTGYFNTALGYNSLYSNTTGSNNTVLGYRSLYSNTTGAYNTVLGYRSLYSNTTGAYNTALGYGSGRYIQDGSSPNQTSNSSVYIGSNTKALADGDTNEIVIGYNATGAGSNSVVLGNSSITKTILNGNVGIGTDSPDTKLHVAGTTGSVNQYISTGDSGNTGLYFANTYATTPNYAGIQFSSADDKLRIFNAQSATNHLAIDNAGKVTIGTTYSAPTLDNEVATKKYVDDEVGTKQDSLTFGIADTNSVIIDSTSVTASEYAKFTANGLESRSATEVKTDLSLDNVENTALSTWTGTSNITTLGTITTGTWNGNAIPIANGGTGQTSAQSAINALTQVSGATNEYVLTKDTSTGNATWKASQGGGTTLAKLQQIYGLLANQNGVNYTGTLNNNTITVHTTTANSKSFFNFSFTNTTTTAQTISLLVDDTVIYKEELNAGENRNLADVLHQPYFVADTTIKVQSTSTTIDYNINVIDVLDSELTGFFMLVGNTTGSEQTLKTAGASTKIKLLGEVFSNTDTVNRTITTKINDKAVLSAQTIGVNQGCLAMLNQGKTINSSQTYKITSSSTNVKYLVFGYEG